MQFNELYADREYYDYCDICHRDEVDVRSIKRLELGGHHTGEIAMCDECRMELRRLIEITDGLPDQQAIRDV